MAKGKAMLTFGRYLALEIVNSHKTAEQVATAVHVSEAAVVAWIDNKAVPTAEQLSDLAHYLPDSMVADMAAGRMPEPKVRPGYCYRDRSKPDPYKIY
ncbi:MAG: hypothetical protein SOZ01_01870 [Selenomonadaceae bacterium]|nr:hypothetical protein [Selenomonadaceae bacterium]